MIDIHRRSFIFGAAAVLVVPERTFHIMPKRRWLMYSKGDIIIVDDPHYETPEWEWMREEFWDAVATANGIRRRFLHE